MKPQFDILSVIKNQSENHKVHLSSSSSHDFTRWYDNTFRRFMDDIWAKPQVAVPHFPGLTISHIKRAQHVPRNTRKDSLVALIIG
jgi:hypothetical protein